MKKFLFCIAILVIGLAPNLSYAQSELGRDRNIKNVSEARGLAFTNTMMPVVTGLGSVWLFEDPTIHKIGSALAMYGLVVGPSTANFHAEDYTRGMIGILARLGAGLVLKDATREVFGPDVSDALGWDKKEVSLSDTNMLIGAGVFVGSAVYNVIAAKRSVDNYNSNRGYNMAVAPMVHQGKLVPAVSGRINF